ncbi:MAG: Transcriptional regulatory protein ZraR [Syntrophus sp. PtaU1.Bin005]|jgi:two-component system response regulator PilR (NtrC family)|uniref:sigma-54-dependent transcriptional regulator n=1 Tax=Syntrophus sp. (in: bacteria) TaxID=48412 RepID=UPI0009CA27C5|nr:MAG: Transcriptional regulatory protein ZraR [Syntrophus sp. PtaB.Bin138]OPY81814.1 MAG: Transcriptional regulatory protein ZraR [Syntrophus sp. PtaU1.Bin005]
MATILVVDDDKGMREFLDIMLTREGYDVRCASNAAEALTSCRKRSYDLILTDLKMPRMDGLEFLKAVKEISPESLVILITAYASGETAVRAMKEGAYDYIEKNFNIEEFTSTIRNALESNGRMRDDAKFIRDMENAASFGEMIGKSREMRKVYTLIKKVAETTANVLVLGESGTGKELVAKAIHAHSPRKDKPFIAINCGGIPETLLESELFGYMKGSFTGAYAEKAGLFEIARGGTVFLDEVGELPPVLQVKLLRVVQEKTFLRIGGTESIRVDVRIISATNRNLEEMIRKGEFREDLYYRLNVIPVRIPALRERKEDIAILTRYFIEKYAREFGKGIRNISNYGLELLMDYSFPGNVRELENIIERSVALEQSNIILPENLVISGSHSADQGDGCSNPGPFPDQGINLGAEMARFERDMIERALEKSNGSKTRAAELLQVSFDSLRYRIEKLGM